MSDILYKWVNYPENKPKERKAYPILFRYENDRPKDKPTMDTTAWDGKKWTEMGEGNTVVKFLDEYTPPPPSSNPHEQILQLLITGGFLDPGKLKEARSIIGGCAPSGSLETDFKELNHYFTDLYQHGVNQVKDAGHLWIAFSDKFNAFQKKVLANSFSPSIVDELRNADPFDNEAKAMRIAWKKCCDKLSELLTPQK